MTVTNKVPNNRYNTAAAQSTAASSDLLHSMESMTLSFIHQVDLKKRRILFCFVLNHFEINDERQNKKIKERRMREGKGMGFITHWGADRPVLLLLQCDL